MYSLDMSNPKGQCQPGDPSHASDHGHPCTETDIIRLAQHTNCKLSTHNAPNGTHTLLSKNVPGAINTVILLTGGDHIPHCLDNSDYPNGYLLPGNTLHLWSVYNINVILVIPPYTMDWSWSTRMKNRNKVYRDSNKMIHVKKNQKIPPHVGVFNSLLMLEEDMDHILRSIPEQQRIWMSGHCSSADFIARYVDVETLIKPHGIIMWNPLWLGWQNNNTETYFQTQQKSNLLVVQHRQDTALSTSVERAKHIVDYYNFKKKLQIVEGGINQGLPCFSMGYHGFRGMEEQLVELTAEFINNSLEMTI